MNPEWPSLIDLFDDGVVIFFGALAACELAIAMIREAGRSGDGE